MAERNKLNGSGVFSHRNDHTSSIFSFEGGVDGLPLRVSNEGLPRPRVVRAQEIIYPALSSPSERARSAGRRRSGCSAHSRSKLPKRPLKKHLGQRHMLFNIRLQMPRSRLPVVGRISDAAGEKDELV